jgi:hypothetical protein
MGQRQGLAWMLSSESGELPTVNGPTKQFWVAKKDNVGVYYSHTLTQTGIREKPTMVKGGILADDVRRAFSSFLFFFFFGTQILRCAECLLSFVQIYLISFFVFFLNFRYRWGLVKLCRSSRLSSWTELFPPRPVPFTESRRSLFARSA